MFILYFIQSDSLDKDWQQRLVASLRSFGSLPDDTRFCLADYSKTPSVPEELLSHYSIEHIHTPAPLPFNRSWSINYAYKTFARKEDTHFLFTDIDLVFPRNFLADAYRTLNNNKRGIVIPNLFYLPQNVSDTSATYTELSIKAHKSWRTFFSGSCLCPVELFEQVHGFDEMFIGWGAEDNDFINRVTSVGAEVIKSPSLKVMHLDHPRTAEQNSDLVTKNRARLAKKECGEIVLIDDIPWGQNINNKNAIKHL